MARRSRGLNPIQSIKHYVQFANATIGTGTIANLTVVDAVSVTAVGANSNEVEEGSIVKAVHIEMWCLCSGSSGAITQFNYVLEKVPAAQTPVTFTQSLNLGAYPNKKNVLYTSQGNLPSRIDTSGTIPIMRGWFLIPKGKQRMGLGDKIVLSLASTGSALDRCGMMTYKEYK